MPKESNHKFIKDLKVTDKLDQDFHVTKISQRTTKSGSTYYQLELRDVSGKIAAKIWDNLPEVHQVAEDSFVSVKGKMDVYKGVMQIIIDDIKPVPPEDINRDLFAVAPVKDIELLYEKLQEYLTKIEDHYLGELKDKFLEDEIFMGKFKASPAAIEIHHAYPGGLLEHTVNLMNLAERIAEFYYKPGESKEPLINRDLLITGIFLHDIGKIKEYEMKISPQMTDEGKLLGHTIMGIMMLEEKIRQIEDFPAQYKILLEHLIGSHHGQREYGAPVLPMTPEALVLHYLDNLDARMGEYMQLSQKSDNSAWTEWSKSLERQFYKTPINIDNKSV